MHQHSSHTVFHYISTTGKRKLMVVEPSLLVLATQGDKKAQHALYKQTFSLLMGICSRYAYDRDEAMALLNQGFLKILTNAGQRKEHVPVEAWMRRVMINTIIDVYRQNKTYREQTTLVDYSDHAIVHAYEGGNDHVYLEKINSEALYHMMTKLPDMTARVFNLFAIDGYSHKEIADMLRMSEGTSKWHVNNARTLLKNMLNELD
jgi:RNA polymerase sigma-70 factor (ECF subfamily)